MAEERLRRKEVVFPMPEEVKSSLRVKKRVTSWGVSEEKSLLKGVVRASCWRKV